MTMTLVETIEVGSGGAASIEFTNIPQTGVDLLLVLSGRGQIATVEYAPLLKINNLTTGIYSQRTLRGSGSAASSFSQSSATTVYFGDMPAANATSNTFGNNSYYFSNYASSSNKSYSVDSVTENNGTEAWQWLQAGQVATMSAIQTITVSSGSGDNFVQYSTASLYIIS